MLFPSLGTSIVLALPLLTASGSETPAVGQNADVRLERALETIQTHKLSADLHFLASDELAGRDSPSFEQRIAARFLRHRVQRLGLEPGNGERYLYEYELVWRAIDPEASELVIEAGNLRLPLGFGSDYFINDPSGAIEQTLSGGVVYGGLGTKAELDGLDLEGKWVLVLDDGGGLGEEQSEMERSRLLFSRRNTARRAGAMGLLVAPRADYAGVPYERLLAKTTHRLRQGKVWAPSQAPESGRAGFTNLYLSASAGQALLDTARAGAQLQPGDELGIQVTEERRQAGEDERATLENVCALLPGTDPELSREVIVVSAHYDHVGITGDGEVYNGADDNGSGTTGMLAVAEALAEYGGLTRSVLFIWVSAEEKGLLGSQEWCLDPSLPEGYELVANMNMDMIGRNAPDELLYTPTEAMGDIHNGMARLLAQLAPLEGFTKLGSADEYYGRSDQINFQRHFGIPVMFVFADVHEDYHQVTDTPDKIDYDKVRRVSRLVVRLLTQLQSPKLDL
jgi:hypothetical protein